MLKTSIFASTMAVLLSISLAMPSEAEPKIPKKNRKQQQRQQQQELQSQQGTYDNSNNRNDSSGGSASSGSGSSGGSDSISMFKAGNTSLPAGTYAMTNVSNGAAFVVIVDETGDMRAQDARAMNLIDDKNAGKTAKNNRKNNNGNPGNNQGYNDYSNSGDNYNSSNNYNSNNDNSGGRANSSGSNLGPNGLLPPQQTPASAVLPTPNASSHPLLQGATQGSVYQPQQSGGGLTNLFTSPNPLAQQNPLMPGQPAPGGIQGKIQAELQRQLNKQLMKYGGTGNLEQQVRKMINKF